MIHQWDEFSKSLAEAVPRRESMRRIGLALAGVLTPLGLNNAFATTGDRCTSFCRCRKRSDQNACLAACRACTGATSRLCGTCGSYLCSDVASDFDNCGACGHACRQPGLYESGACVSGKCVYACIPDTVRCNGICTALDSDRNNCGACGNVCPDSAPYCNQGVCFDPGCDPGLTFCGDGCVDLNWDNLNCGACFNQCTGGDVCSGGQCQGICVGCYPY
jgi:hypothetical protein